MRGNHSTGLLYAKCFDNYRLKYAGVTAFGISKFIRLSFLNLFFCLPANIIRE